MFQTKCIDELSSTIKITLFEVHFWEETNTVESNFGFFSTEQYISKTWSFVSLFSLHQGASIKPSNVIQQ